MTALDTRPTDTASTVTQSTDVPAQHGGYRHIQVAQVSEDIGARISGVRLSGELDTETVAEIRRALLAHKVVFFSGQDHLDDVGQYEFAQLLGEPTAPHPTVPGSAHAVLPIDSDNGKANSWHSDVTFVDRIPAFSVLRAIELPAYGGTTTWANTAKAYERLHPGLQALAESLRALHTNLYDYVAERTEPTVGGIDVKEEGYREAFKAQVFETEHPLVRVHPETGERVLVLGHFISRIKELTTSDSKALFDLFQRHITRLENTVRWNWTPGDLAIWDNRATQHYGVDDYGTQKRVLHRITIAGDVPVGVDGRPSVVRQGDATSFSQLGAAG